MYRIHTVGNKAKFNVDFIRELKLNYSMVSLYKICVNCHKCQKPLKIKCAKTIQATLRASGMLRIIALQGCCIKLKSCWASHVIGDVPDALIKVTTIFLVRIEAIRISTSSCRTFCSVRTNELTRDNCQRYINRAKTCTFN